MRNFNDSNDRAQAFTLEGFIGGLLVLAAVLFALQATVFTPNTSGATSPETQLALERQAEDVLRSTATAEEKDLSYYVRYWDVTELTFAGAKNPEVGYGSAGPPGPLGDRLYDAFGQRGHSYNLVVTYQADHPNATESVRMVYQGDPPSSAVVATYTITLYDGQTLTGPDTGYAKLTEFNATDVGGGEGYYPIPDAAPNSSVYNVVEVRLVVW
ncbi:MAG: DUF7288 family protein [Halodesulfurarchaeum sp.]